MKRDALKFVIKNLVSNQKHKEAHTIIDAFYETASDLEEFDILGEMALIGKYYEMQLKCAINAYTRAKGDELFPARENLIKAYNTMNYPEKAMFYINLNLREKPKNFDALATKAFTMSLMNKKKESEELLINLMANDDKQKKNLEYSLAGKQIREGETAKGILNFTAAFKPKNEFFEDKLNLKLWTGQIEPGKTIVINGEGGIGDEIINVRFLKNIKDLGMNPILYSSWYRFRPDLVDVFRRHGFEVVTTPYHFHKDWYFTHMMSIPGYLNLSEKNLWTGPYLEPQRKEKNQLNDTNFKIGIKCNGNPYFEQDVYRTIPIEQILEVLPKNASIYYFDKDKEYPGTISLKDKLNTWEDTLDYLGQMDVIVSSCTSIVHAAGAIGKRCMVLTPISEYYTWTSTRTNETTPWYGDNMTVLKQQKVRSWKEPLERVRQLLNG